mgnify:CR=1 FL=1
MGETNKVVYYHHHIYERNIVLTSLSDPTMFALVITYAIPSKSETALQNRCMMTCKIKYHNARALH